MGVYTHSRRPLESRPYGSQEHHRQYILREHGIEPAQERSERTPWRTFLAAHWETVAATDFFTVEGATVRRLVTYYVLVVIELSSRKVHIAGITSFDGFLRGKRFLILDRDKKFTTEFRDLLEHAGTDVIRLPHRSPNLNALSSSLSIADYACGSAVFLTEILHALERRGYIGEVRLIGRDVSAEALVMAKVASPL